MEITCFIQDLHKIALRFKRTYSAHRGVALHFIFYILLIFSEKETFFYSFFPLISFNLTALTTWTIRV